MRQMRLQSLSTGNYSKKMRQTRDSNATPMQQTCEIAILLILMGKNG